MEKNPVIRKENVVPLFESRYIKVYDLQYQEGRHYYDASRRELQELTAVKNEEEFKEMLPDAVTCIVIVKSPDEEPRLLLFYEYRYPTGQFLLSPPAGLLDPEDRETAEPLLRTAAREIFEETGLAVKEGDRLFAVSPLLFSSPGMTDESNALVCAVMNVRDLSAMTNRGNVGTEVIREFQLLSREEARKILRDGRDPEGRFYSVYTWAALMYYLSGMWERE